MNLYFGMILMMIDEPYSWDTCTFDNDNNQNMPKYRFILQYTAMNTNNNNGICATTIQNKLGFSPHH